MALLNPLAATTTSKTSNIASVRRVDELFESNSLSWRVGSSRVCSKVDSSWFVDSPSLVTW